MSFTGLTWDISVALGSFSVLGSNERRFKAPEVVHTEFPEQCDMKNEQNMLKLSNFTFMTIYDHTRRMQYCHRG